MYNVAVIGVGGIARVHMKTLNQIPDVRLVAIMDADQERANSTASEFGTQAVPDYRAAIEAADVVFLCTPPHIRREIAIAAAQAGKHLFIEKPLALTLEDADAMIAAARDGGVQMMIGYVLRFTPSFRKLRELLKEGVLGELKSCMTQRYSYLNYAKSAWMNSPEMSGGIVLEFLTHDIDWLSWLGGHPQMAYAAATTANPAGRIIDTVWANLTFQQGMGTTLASYSMPVSNTLLAVQGDRGMAAVQGTGPLHVKLFDGSAQEYEMIAGGYDYLTQNLTFFDCLKDGRPVEVNGQVGRAALEVALALVQSAAIHEVVRL
ncbi:MAG: Gfo/Idh/MocA family oxidoreductase [Chloroflexi bacterium]|nr:Gfo/Idh/MocA family oxidoreductase [Chloroflexota bacterium]